MIDTPLSILDIVCVLLKQRPALKGELHWCLTGTMTALTVAQVFNWYNDHFDMSLFQCWGPDVVSIMMTSGTLKEFRQPLQVQSHLEMPRILVQLGHIQRT